MTTQSPRLYIVYDGRAALDVDRASVLYTTHDLDEAVGVLKFFADAIVYSYATGGEYLTDARVENVQRKGEAAK